MKQIIGPTAPFRGVSLYSGDKARLLSALTSFVQHFHPKTSSFLKIYTPNPEQMVLARENPAFFHTLLEADILLPDGAGLVWAIHRQQGLKSEEAMKVQRIPGREVFHDLLGISTDKKWKVFLLGGSSGSAKAVLDQWIKKTGDETITWQYDDGSKENSIQALEKIRAYQPDLLFVAYGAPWQELWIERHQDILEKAEVKIAMVVGGAFEYESGKIPSISPLVENLHLEWLQRLILEPWRWRRQLKGVWFFVEELFSSHS
ncbi:MAG: WecB/TagA/CpsF family glycosyltransferase [Candidatus Woesebacteria bacterium]